MANIDITAILKHHRRCAKNATLTAVQPPGRYGALNLDGNSVVRFQEKPQGDHAWINGGFFVVEPQVLDLISTDDCSWESDILPVLANTGQLSSFQHYGFWQPMDTLRDRVRLDAAWNEGDAPWKIW